MSYASMGSLLPRDFLERQPKRWQKSQRKRRVLPTLRKMKAKREKLETKVYEQAQRDAGIDLKYKPEAQKRKAPEEGPVSRPASKAPAPAAAAKAAPALVELSDGLKYHDVKAGKGIKAGPGAKLTVKYAGLAPDPRAKGGWKEFDSNGGKPLHFSLGHGEVIRGWDAGLVGMCQGGTRRLVVPPSMAYGEGGAGPVPPKATLIFEVTLLNVT